MDGPLGRPARRPTPPTPLPHSSARRMALPGVGCVSGELEERKRSGSAGAPSGVGGQRLNNRPAGPAAMPTDTLSSRRLPDLF